MKKVCLVDFDMSVTGGVEHVTCELANRLVEEYEVHIYTIRNENGITAYTLKEDIICSVGEEKAERIRQLIPRCGKRFRKYLCENEIDTVLFMGVYSAFILLWSTAFLKVKFIYCDHGALMNQWTEKSVTIMRYLSAILADKVVVLTERTKEDYIQQFKIKRKKIECIYNWVDTSDYVCNTKYNQKSQMILSVGRISKEKGYDLLIKVANLVLPKYPNWQWHVYGDGELFQEIAAEIANSNLEEQLILKGNVTNVRELYKEYSFLVLPSYREGLPLVLLEAKVNALPLVSFDILTGPREIIEDNENGYLVSPYSIEEMAERIERLISSEELRKSFSQGTKKNLKKFEKEQIILQWKRIIDYS